MTVTVTPLLSGKLDQRHGKGPKFLLANVTLEPSIETLRPSAKYLDMKTIKAVYPMLGPSLGSYVLANVVAPGSVGNYASFTAYRIKMAAGTLSIPGGLAATGTITTPMLIIGE